MNTIRPSLKRLHSPDIPDLKSFVPKNKKSFGFLLQAMFGPEASEGEESFDMIVCTPEWLANELKLMKIISGRYHIIVDEYDFEKIISFLDAYGRQCVGSTWRDVALQLSRIGKWEFEDYERTY